MGTSGAARLVDHAGYELVRSEELGLGAEHYDELVHRASGARHIHIVCQEPDSAFAVLVPTAVEDSTGTAHVLEHMIGCGSRAYDAHNAFYAMIDRSLVTFLNGLTTPAWMAFAFCTPLQQDYRNLVGVLLDGIFHPRLSDLAFGREGHRLEFSDHDDPSTQLVRRGVVLNEMRPMQTSSAAALELAMGRGLYPSLPYAHNAGGDPEALPTLDVGRVRAFHRRFFHPAASVFLSFGRIPLTDVLSWVQPYLEPDRRMPSGRARLLQPALEPRRLQASYACGGTRQQPPQALLAWATADWSEPFEVFCLRVLRELHLGDPGSRLRRALRAAGFCGPLADGSGLHAQFFQVAFSVGAKGVPPEQAEALERAVLDALQYQPAPDDVAVAVHRLRLRQREAAADGPPRAVRLLQELANPILYGGDAVAAIDWTAHLQRLGTGEAAADVLRRCAHRWLLDNQHRLLVTLSPDANLLAARAGAERQRLLQARRALDPVAAARLVRRADALRSWPQRSPGERLPLLGLHELDTLDADATATRFDDDLAVRAMVTRAPTGDLVYLDVLLDTTGLPSDLRRHLPLWARQLTRFGSTDDQVAVNQDRIRRYTGGVEVSFRGRQAPDGAGGTQSRLCWSVQFLAEDADRVLALLREALRPGPRLGAAQELRLLRQRQAALIARDQSRTACSWAAANVSPAAAAQDAFDGIAALEWSERLLSRGEGQSARLQPALQVLDEVLLQRARVVVSITAEASVYRRLRPALARCLSACAWSEASPAGSADDRPRPVRRVVGIDRRAEPSATACNARAYPMPALGHPDCGALAVLGEHLRGQFLWRTIRELGGAYSVGAVASPELAAFQLWSERDPNVEDTFEAFDEAIWSVAQAAPEPVALHRAKLAAVRRQHRWPSHVARLREATWRSLDGHSSERLAAFQRQIVATGARQLPEAAARWLLAEAGSDVSLGAGRSRHAPVGARDD